jgi:hypothetical protein
MMQLLKLGVQFLAFIHRNRVDKANKFVNRTFFTSLRFAVAAPLYRKTPLHKKCPLQKR